MDHPQEFLRICQKNGLRVDPGQFDQLRQYVDLLSAWNSRINLISRRDIENVWFSHILHSLAPWFRVRLPSGRAILDIGSGGGLPGIPLAILRTDLSIMLLDSIQKKTKALTDICSEMELPNVRVLNGRAEDVASRGEYAFRFSVVLARGVAPLVDLIRWSRPFLRRQEEESTGNEQQRDLATKRLLDTPCLLAWKGGDLEDEIGRASRISRQEEIEVLPLLIEGGYPSGLEKKHLVVVRFK